MGNSFFSGVAPTLQILLSFMVFAIDAFSRPFGGVVFGHVGDVYGRKSSMTLINSSEMLSWRDAFIFGAILALIGVYFHFKVSESPEFLALKEKKTSLKIHC